MKKKIYPVYYLMMFVYCDTLPAALVYRFKKEVIYILKRTTIYYIYIYILSFKRKF